MAFLFPSTRGHARRDQLVPGAAQAADKQAHRWRRAWPHHRVPPQAACREVSGMAYWTATRLQAHRESKAEFFLRQFGFETYLPRVRYRTSRKRLSKTAPLFPGY